MSVNVQDTRGSVYANELAELLAGVGPDSSLEALKIALSNSITFFALKIIGSYGFINPDGHPRGGPYCVRPDGHPRGGPYVLELAEYVLELCPQPKT